MTDAQRKLKLQECADLLKAMWPAAGSIDPEKLESHGEILESQVKVVWTKLFRAREAARRLEKIHTALKTLLEESEYKRMPLVDTEKLKPAAAPAARERPLTMSDILRRLEIAKAAGDMDEIVDLSLALGRVSRMEYRERMKNKDKNAEQARMVREAKEKRENEEKELKFLHRKNSAV